ncbi:MULTISPECIES: dTDP-glucose 4,6-dehydratase [Streptomyces]|uniref:dTDP-glucose 4,6-dehydratase n=1 Tax=Streptomyces misionensis TaxID=67331 RepID=A0A1H5BAX1_9ACTN|nr:MULTISPECIES: dTDP-glucose 4,6-dehydratase [Streptomyces]SED51682.1 dTDP-glucose 4,6-dehydratase [Streptomyces misionensis]SFY53537.1 dTDP-glucose 4,6-dehydratase [Streptomyces sp. F-1]
MRLLVTGGAGFIGSEFVRSLLSSPDPVHRGLRITVLDDLTYAGVMANLAPVAGHPGFTFVRGDICDADLVDQVLPGHDAVVHFAAESHVDRSIAGARPFAVTNVLGTQTLLDAAHRHGTGRFVHVSTDEVYGSIDSGAWTEESPLAPNSPYAASKAGSDLLVLAAHRTHGLDVVVTRCSNNYGPYQFPEKLIPLFVTNLLDGRHVPLYGAGRNVREWLHVVDHCRGIDLALRKGRAGQVYHLGGGRELTNSELTGLLLAATGSGWEMVRRVPDRKGHDLRYALDCGKAEAELGYTAEVEFEDGLADTVAWYREHRDWWEPLKSAGPEAR